MKKSLFLDRDGVINVDKNYVIKKSDIEFIDGIFKLVRTANFAGYMVIVVTNQSGIGRNMYSLENFSFANLLTSSKISLIIFMIIGKIELISIFLIFKKLFIKD